MKLKRQRMNRINLDKYRQFIKQNSFSPFGDAITTRYDVQCLLQRNDIGYFSNNEIHIAFEKDEDAQLKLGNFNKITNHYIDQANKKLTDTYEYYFDKIHIKYASGFVCASLKKQYNIYQYYPDEKLSNEIIQYYQLLFDKVLNRITKDINTLTQQIKQKTDQVVREFLDDSLPIKQSLNNSGNIYITSTKDIKQHFQKLNMSYDIRISTITFNNISNEDIYNKYEKLHRHKN